jgi:hypothetical protein
MPKKVTLLKIPIGSPAPPVSLGWVHVRNLPRLGVSVYQRHIVTNENVSDLADMFAATGINEEFQVVVNDDDNLSDLVGNLSLGPKAGGRRRKRSRKSYKSRKSRKSRRSRK